MNVTKINLDDIDLDSSLTLTVGWKSGSKTNLRRLETAGEVDTAFREVIGKIVADLKTREEQSWSPDADLTRETYLAISVGDLGDLPELETVHDGRRLHEVLAQAQGIESMDASSLPRADLSFYALTLGDVGDRKTFLRRSNVRRGL